MRNMYFVAQHQGQGGLIVAFPWQHLHFYFVKSYTRVKNITKVKVLLHFHGNAYIFILLKATRGSKTLQKKKYCCVSMATLTLLYCQQIHVGQKRYKTKSIVAFPWQHLHFYIVKKYTWVKNITKEKVLLRFHGNTYTFILLKSTRGSKTLQKKKYCCVSMATPTLLYC